MTVPLRTERWRSNLQGDAATTFVAATDHVIGFASIGANRDGLDDDVSELFALYVLPEHWGRGYGWRLYDYAREHCCSASSALVLWVLDGNDRAIRFYERCGYALDGATKTIELGDRNYDESRMRCNFTG